MNSDTVLIVSANETQITPPVLTDLNGRTHEVNFTFKSNQVYQSCSLIFKNRVYFFQHKHVSVIENCELRKKGSLKFDFNGSHACTSTLNTIFLCFYVNNLKICRTDNDPIGPFDTIVNSNYEHGLIQIAASASKLLLV